MDSLIFISPFVNKFLTFFQFIFARQTKPARQSLLLLLLGIVVTSCLSVRKCYTRVVSRISGKSLNSFYFLLKNGKIDLNVWSAQLIRLALRCIPAEYEDAPILLAVDDTLVEKEGSHFAHRERLFDHSGPTFQDSRTQCARLQAWQADCAPADSFPPDPDQWDRAKAIPCRSSKPRTRRHLWPDTRAQ